MKKFFIQMLLISMTLLLFSCEKSSDFQVLNYSDTEWERFDPSDAQKLVTTDLQLLLKKHQENPEISLFEDSTFFYQKGEHHENNRIFTTAIPKNVSLLRQCAHWRTLWFAPLAQMQRFSSLAPQKRQTPSGVCLFLPVRRERRIEHKMRQSGVCRGWNYRV